VREKTKMGGEKQHHEDHNLNKTKNSTDLDVTGRDVERTWYTERKTVPNGTRIGGITRQDAREIHLSK